MKRYWISWYQTTGDYRPVNWPLPDNIEYWCSGTRCSDDASILCAVVDVENSPEEAIKEFWPEASEWRFCEEKPLDWEPGNRFLSARKKSK